MQPIFERSSKIRHFSDIPAEIIVNYQLSIDEISVCLSMSKNAILRGEASARPMVAWLAKKERCEAGASGERVALYLYNIYARKGLHLIPVIIRSIGVDGVGDFYDISALPQEGKTIHSFNIVG